MKEMKKLIMNAGMSYVDCFEKSELRTRALDEAIKKTAAVNDHTSGAAGQLSAQEAAQEADAAMYHETSTPTRTRVRRAQGHAAGR